MVGDLFGTVLDALNRHKARILDYAAIGLLPEQYQAFRRQFLEELGKSGFERELQDIITQHQERKR